MFWVRSGLYQSVSSSNSSAQASPQLPRSPGIKAQVLTMLCRVLPIYCVHPLTTLFWSHWPPWCSSYKHLAPASGHMGSYSLACNASPKDPHGFLLHLLPSWPSYLKLPPYSFPQILTSSLFLSFPILQTDAFTYLFIMSSPLESMFHETSIFFFFWSVFLNCYIYKNAWNLADTQ